MKTVNGHEIIQLFESFSPRKYAETGDPVGLQIGSLNKKVQNVMIALDVLEEVADEAIERNVDLIIAHHPPIFRPLKNLITDQPQGRIFEKLIKHNITVYAAHTNLDVAPGGVNDLLADALHLHNIEVLVPTYQEALKKLVVFVPVSDGDKLRIALANAGAGAIGNYSSCSFSSEGEGRFLPGQNTSPHIGKPGRMETVKEVRIETIFPANLEKKIITAMIKAHPYEEVAYDIYPLENQGETLGLGRIGELAGEMTLEEFAAYVKKCLDVKGLRVVGALNEKVKKVAVLGGDGNKFFTQARFKGADVFVTGDFYYHNAHDAMNLGLKIVDPGHNVEKVMKKGVASKLKQLSEEKGYSVNYIVSDINTDPFTFL